MKKKLHLFLAFTFVALFSGGVSSAFADDVTVSFVAGTDKGGFTGLSQGNGDKMSKDGITIETTSGESVFARTTPATYLFRKGSTTTISSSVGNISKIVFVGNNSKTSAANFSQPTGMTSSNSGRTYTWTGDAESVTFVLPSNATSTVQAASISVTYKSSNKVASLSFAKKGFSFVKGNVPESFSGQTVTTDPAGLKVTYSISPADDNFAIIDANSGEVLLDGNTTGKAVVTATLAESGYLADPATYVIAVTNPTDAKWKKTDLASLTSNDVFVIADTHTSKALPSDGSSGDFKATPIDLSEEDSVIIGTVPSSLQWNLKKFDDGTVQFNTAKDTTHILCINGGFGLDFRLYGDTHNRNFFTPYLVRQGYYDGLYGTDDGVVRYVGVDAKDNGATKPAFSQWTSCAQKDFTRITDTRIAYYKRIYNIDADITSISSAGYATFASDAAIDYSKTAGLKAFAATYNAESKKITLTPVTAVPAKTAVVLKGAADDYILYSADNSDVLKPVNDLKVSDGSITGDGKTIWALGKKDKGVGFYPVAEGNAVPSGKAYLQLTSASQAKGFIAIDDNESTTAIKTVNAQVQSINAPMYNLAGQRVTKAYKGVVIMNGKKFIQK